MSMQYRDVTVTYPAGARIPLQADVNGNLKVAQGAVGPQTAANSLSITGAGSGVYASADFTPIAGPYSANDTMGTAQEFVFRFADGTLVPPSSIIRLTTSILKIDQIALQTGEGAYVLQTYSVTPPSALADNAAWTLSSADLPSWRVEPVSLGTPVDYGSACAVKQKNLDTEIRLGAGSSLFAYLQTIGGITAPASPALRQVGLIGYLA